MKLTVNFINYRLQERLIKIMKNESIYHRVKANRSIEFAKKWKDTVFDLCVEMMFDLFEQPSLTVEIKPGKHQYYISELSQHNIPFFLLSINKSEVY